MHELEPVVEYVPDAQFRQFDVLIAPVFNKKVPPGQLKQFSDPTVGWKFPGPHDVHTLAPNAE